MCAAPHAPWLELQTSMSWPESPIFRIGVCPPEREKAFEDGKCVFVKRVACGMQSL